MIQQELFAGLFPLPYKYEKWLVDQAVLIERMKKIDDEYIQEQVKTMEGFQEDKQCSILMIEILIDRLKRHEEKKDLTTESKGDINIGMM